MEQERVSLKEQRICLERRLPGGGTVWILQPREEVAKGRGCEKNGGQEPGKQRDPVNNAKGLLWQGRLENRGQVTEVLTAKLVTIAGCIWKAMRAHWRVVKTKEWHDRVCNLGSSARLPPWAPICKRIKPSLSQRKTHYLYTTTSLSPFLQLYARISQAILSLCITIS